MSNKYVNVIASYIEKEINYIKSPRVRTEEISNCLNIRALYYQGIITNSEYKKIVSRHRRRLILILKRQGDK